MVTKTASQRRGRAQGRAHTGRRTRRLACHHHWVIDAPNGPKSLGHCKLCGRTRKFLNSSEDSVWDSTEGRSRWNDMGGARRPRPSDEPILEDNVVTL